MFIYFIVLDQKNNQLYNVQYYLDFHSKQMSFSKFQSNLIKKSSKWYIEQTRKERGYLEVKLWTEVSNMDLIIK